MARPSLLRCAIEWLVFWLLVVGFLTWLNSQPPFEGEGPWH